MAYRADIEIGVKGVQQLQALRKQIDTLSTGVDSVNKRLTGASQSINAYNANLAKAAATLNKVNAGTIAERDAIRQYVTALGQANTARDRQNRLIQQQIALQRKAVATADAGFGMQGPNLPPAARATGAIRRGGGRLGGAISGSIIGGAFPLLFGQGAGAATGGAIGGLLGGLAGPGGSFAGSLLGTLLGDIASKGQAVQQLAQDIGFSADQTLKLSAAFKVANTDVEKFTAVIQNIRGVGLEIDDQARAIQLVTRLTEKYGGSFEKTGNAITSALESGKVTQGTLNQLTSQGINIQQALADKYGVSRNELLKMAKDGKISVQELINILVDLGNKPGQVAKNTQTASQQFQSAIQNLTKVVGPELQRLGSLFQAFGATALNALNGVLVRLGQVGTAIENAIAGDTLKNAQQQFKRDAAALKTLYAVPKGSRTQAQVQRITSLENLQKGRMQVIEAAKPKPLPKLETFKAPSQAAPSATGGSKGKSAADTAADNLSRAQELLRALQQQNALAQTKNDLDNNILKISQDYEKTLGQIAELEDQSLRKSLEAQALRLRNQEINNAVEQHEIKVNEELNKQVQKYMEIDSVRKAAFEGYKNAEIVILRDLTAQAELLKFAFESVGQSFSDSVLQVAEGSTTIQQAVADMFSAIGRSLFNYAAQAITTYIALGVARMFAGIPSVKPANYSGNEMGGIFNAPVFGVDSSGLSGPANPLSQLDYAGIKLRANGGPVSAGSPYIVGERGPELFVPGRSGTIVPNDQMGGSKVEVGSINISVENTGESLSAQAQKQIANQVQGIVMATLVNERRSGGVLR